MVINKPKMDRTIVLGGRYSVVRELGSGGNATVWLADDLHTPGARVAIKVLHPHLVSLERAMDRFATEAKILSALDHPHIARALDFGFDGDLAFIVFEWVQGTALNLELERRSRDQRPFTLEEIEAMARAIASALDYAHKHGVVHRDLKPANMILGPAGLKIVDFGIARITRGDDEATTIGRMMGSVLYMAPEQTEGMPVDARADVFAFGAVLFELLTLHRAWARTADGAPLPAYVRRTGATNAVQHVLKRIRGDERPLPSALRTDVGDRVDLVIVKALSVSAEDRQASAGALLHAFSSAISAERGRAPIESSLRKPVIGVLSVLTLALGIAWGAHAQAPVVRAVLPSETRAQVIEKPIEKPIVLGPEELDVPAGPFTAGCAPNDQQCAADERPGRTVTLGRFAVDLGEETVQSYRSCVEAERCTPPGNGSKCNFERGRDDLPINCIDARQAAELCKFFGKRLPTSDEWEKAARGDDARIFPWGDAPPSCAVANFGGCTGDTAPDHGEHGASAYGAHDMAGNVWEWTSSRSSSGSSGSSGSNGKRVVRGGSFFDVAETLRASNKGSAGAAARAENIGVRCVRSL